MKRADGRRLTRVCHYPGAPHDLGVVDANVPEVLWMDGHADMLTKNGYLSDSMHQTDDYKGRRVLTVSRRKEDIDAIYQQYLNFVE